MSAEENQTDVEDLQDEGSMSIIEHLTELRNRIFVIFAVFI